MNPPTTDRILLFGKRRIPYSLQVMPRKRFRIVVTPGLHVKASAPDTVSEEDVQAAMQSKAPWIARQLDAMQQYHPLPAPHKYISGETFVYLGRQYRLRVETGPNSSAKLTGRFLLVSVPDKQDTASIRKAVDTWYRDHAATTFQKYLDKWQAVAARHGVPACQLVIRRMRTRWGSCSASKRITLNLDLIQTPTHCIEYVIAHELCHLKHHNHSKAFYRLHTRIMPDWPRRKALLDTITLPTNIVSPTYI